MTITTASEAGKSIRNIISSHLSTEDVKKITLQTFFKDRIKIKNLEDNVIVPLIAKQIQLTHQREKEEAIKQGKKAKFLLLKSRKLGMTTWEQALSYRMITTQPNTTCLTLAHTHEDTKKIFRMVNTMANHDMQKPKDMNITKSSVEVPSMNSIFTVGTAGSKALGRGSDINRVHGSEVSRWEGGVDLIEDLVAGLTEAARYGEVMFETTANGAQGYFYIQYEEAMREPLNSSWTPLFYPWFADPVNCIIDYTDDERDEYFDTITDDEKRIVELYSLSIGQMLWRRMKMKDLKKLFPQEYPENWNEAFLVRGISFFDLGMLTEFIKNKKTPLNNRESVLVWKEPEEGKEYCAGADPSEGNAESDYCFMGILEKVSGEQVACLSGKWRPEVFARKCIDLCKHYNNAIFACEINNHGHSVMNTVINTLKYTHLYLRLRVLEKTKYGGVKTEKVPGWLTNAATRPILLDELNEAMEEGFMLVNDDIFIEECKTFVDTGKRYEADSGQHDDRIIGWGISWQCRKQRKKTYIST